MATLHNKANSTAEAGKDIIFRQEFMKHAHALAAFAFRLTKDRTEADDLTQETYLRVWRFMDRYESGTNARAWMFRICYHAFINDYRTRKNLPVMQDFETVVKTHQNDDPAKQIRHVGEDRSNQAAIGDEVLRAVNELSDDFRHVVLLDAEDFTYEEIAALLGIKLGTVRSRLHRARKELGSKLGDYAKNLGYYVEDMEDYPQDNEDEDDDLNLIEK
jgi:RNA polymerase sigma factor (sigma-70 family)